MNRSTFALNEIGCGRRNRTFIFGFKARRVAGYTIPQEMSFGALGFEPRTLRLSGANTVYKTAALPIELCPV